MRKGAAFSAALHASLVAIAIVGLPSWWKPKPIELETVTVEVVSAIEKEPAPPRAMPEPPRPEPPRPEPSRPAPPRETAAPPPPPPPPPPAPQPEPAPPRPVAQPPAPPPAPPPPPVQEAAVPPPPPPRPAPPEPVPAPPPLVRPPEPAPPVPRPRPTTRPEPPAPQQQAARTPPPTPARPRNDNDFDALLKNLTQEAQRQRTTAPPQTAPREQVAAAANAARATGASSIDQQRRAAELVAMVRDQLVRCWSIPAGAKDAGQQRVGIRILLNGDGSLRGAPRIEDTRRFESDAAYRVVAESAIRAIHMCSPLRLPADQYDSWKEISFNFDPKELLGQ